MEKTMDQTKRRRRRTAKQWLALLAEYRRGRQTQEDFARSRGVGVAALRNRLYRKPAAANFAGRSGLPVRRARAKQFVPVRLIDAAGHGRSATAAPTLTVRWPQGPCVELAVAPSTPGVAELILALLGPCSR